MKQVNRSAQARVFSPKQAVTSNVFAQRRSGYSFAASLVFWAVYGYAPVTLAAARGQVAEEQIYVVYRPQGESITQVADRFSVSEQALDVLRRKTEGYGWTSSVWLIPREKVVESAASFYPGYVLYTLSQGETLSSLALSVNRSERELVRLNAQLMSKTRLEQLKAGDTILVPAAADETVEADPLARRHNQAIEPRVAQRLSKAAQALEPAQTSGSDVSVGDLLTQQAVTGAAGLISQQAEGVLSGYGRAKVGVHANTQTNDIDLALDYLHPLIEGNNDTLFAQVGSRQFDERTIGNVGVGYRALVRHDLMLGGNAFIDQDFTRSHTRAGIGVEAWTEQTRLAANAYAPVSGWKTSDQDSLNPDPERFDLYERPAAGWDARAEISLPGAPKLAGTASYFTWKGEGVDIFGDGNLERDPTGYSIGIKWQPIPMMTFNAEHEQIQGGDSQLTVGANLTWSFDRDLSSQINPQRATALRPLALARKDFVQREYNIVLDYKTKEKPLQTPFAFVESTLVVAAPGGLVPNARVSDSPALQGVHSSAVVRYEKGAVTPASKASNSKRTGMEITVDPSTGQVSIPPGAAAATVEVLAHHELNGEVSAVASYQLVVNDPTDTDGEGLVDDDERILGTDPSKPDTDGDNWTDKEEVDAGTDPLDPDSSPAKPIVDVTDIQGVLQVNHTLTAHYAFNANGGHPTDASVMTWNGGGHADNDTDYVLDVGDIGRILTFEVQAKNAAGELGNVDSLDTANAPGVSGGGNPPGSVVGTGQPVVDVTDIQGVLQVNHTLTAHYVFDANGGHPTDASVMAWNGGGHADHDTDYVLDVGDIGRILTFEVQAKNAAGEQGNVDSLDTASAPGVSGGGNPPGSVVAVGTPHVENLDIVGVLQKGRTLDGKYDFVHNGGNPDSTSLYSWTGGGHTDFDDDYLLGDDDVGKIITFEVQARNGAGVVGNTASISTADAASAIGGGTPPGTIIDRFP